MRASSIIQRKVIGLLPLLLLIAWQPVAARRLPGRSVSWQRVRDLKPGTDVEVMLKNGMTVKGEVSSASDNALSLDDNSKKRDIDRSEISRINEFKHKVRADAWKGARIGFKISAPLRKFFGAGGCSDRVSCVLLGFATAVSVVVFVPAGTAGGLTVGLSHKHQEPVYVAP